VDENEIVEPVTDAPAPDEHETTDPPDPDDDDDAPEGDAVPEDGVDPV